MALNYVYYFRNRTNSAIIRLPRVQNLRMTEMFKIMLSLKLTRDYKTYRFPLHTHGTYPTSQSEDRK